MDGQREASNAINELAKGGKQRQRWTAKGRQAAPKMDGQMEARKIETANVQMDKGEKR